MAGRALEDELELELLEDELELLEDELELEVLDELGAAATAAICAYDGMPSASTAWAVARRHWSSEPSSTVPPVTASKPPWSYPIAPASLPEPSCRPWTYAAARSAAAAAPPIRSADPASPVLLAFGVCAVGPLPGNEPVVASWIPWSQVTALDIAVETAGVEVTAESACTARPVASGSAVVSSVQVAPVA